MIKPSSKVLLSSNSIDQSHDQEEEYSEINNDFQLSPERNPFEENPTKRGNIQVIEYKKEQQEIKKSQQVPKRSITNKSSVFPQNSSLQEIQGLSDVIEEINSMKEASNIQDIDLPKQVKILISTKDNKLIYYTKTLIKRQKISENFQKPQQPQRTSAYDSKELNLKRFIENTTIKGQKRNQLPPINKKGVHFDKSSNEQQEEVKGDESPKSPQVNYEYKIHIKNLNKINQTNEDQTILVKQNVFKLFYGRSGKHLFIAYLSGLLEIREIWNLNETGRVFKNFGRIHDLVSDDSEFLIASDVEGRVIYLKFRGDEEYQGYRDLQNKGSRACTHLMLTPDSKLLLGLQNQLKTLSMSNASFCSLKILIWDLKGYKKIESITIHLQDLTIISKSLLRKIASRFHQKQKDIESDASSQQSDEQNNLPLEVVDEINSEKEEIQPEDEQNEENKQRSLGLGAYLSQLKNAKDGKKKNKSLAFMTEKVSKISQITHDSRYLIVRDQEFKGVQIIYLLDGSLINEYREIHKQPIVEILVSKNNQYILTASRDNKVKVFDFIKEQVVATLSSHQKPVTSIEFTPDQNYLFSYGFGTQVIMWSTQTWQRLCFFKTSFIVQELIVTADQRFLILEGEDKEKVQYLEIEYNEDVQRIGVDEEEIEDAVISPCEDYISFLNKDQSITIWNRKEGTLCTKIQAEDPQIETMVNKPTIIYSNKGDLFSYDPNTQYPKEQSGGQMIYDGKDIKNDINYFIINKDGTKIVLLSQGCYLLTYGGSYEGKEQYYCKQGPLITTSNFIQGCLSTDEKKLFAVSDFAGTQRKAQQFQSIYMFDIQGDMLRLNTEIKLQLKALYDVCCGPKGKYIFICGETTDLIYYYFHDKAEANKNELFKELKGHTRPPTQVALTRYSKFIVSKNDNEIIVWRAKDAQILTLIEGSFIFVLSKEQKLFGLIHHNQYKKWSGELIEKLSDDNLPIELKQEKQSKYQDDQIKISGHVNMLFDRIFANFKSEPKEVQLKFVPAIAKTYFYPFKINMLHYFAYQNNQHALHACIDFGVMYQRNVFGTTPLGYAFLNNSVESINYLLKYLSSKTNLYCQMNQEEIIQAINSSSQMLEQFFSNAVLIQQNVPQFGRIKGSEMYFNESESLNLSSDQAQEIFLRQEETTTKIPIQFKAIKFKLNFTPGTKLSLDFHKALDSTDADAIFKTEAIQMILKYKWQKVRLYSLINVIPLIVFALVLFMHSVYGRYYYEYLIFFGIFGGIFVLIEGVQMVVNFKGYFTDFWNVFDLIRLVFIIVYIVLQLNLIKKLDDIDPELEHCFDIEETRGCFPDNYFYPQNILVVLNSLVWIRILSYLRLFKQTRALIRLLIEVIKDMVSFTIVLFVALIAIAINYTNINNNSFKNDHILDSFKAQLKQTFLLIFSSFTSDIQYEHSFQMVLFSFAAVLIPLIMLNMLIAIMGDTFERVSSTKIETDGRELNLLILEQESLMFWVRDKKKKKDGKAKEKKSKKDKKKKKKSKKESKKKSQDVHLHWAMEFNNLQQWAGRLQVIQQTIFEASQTTKSQDQIDQVMQKFNESSKKHFNALSMRFSLFQKSMKRQIRGLKQQVNGDNFQNQKTTVRKKTLKEISPSQPKPNLMRKFTKKSKEYPAQIRVESPIKHYEQPEEEEESKDVSSFHSDE